MGDFDEIELVVTRPVQKEIDSLKGRVPPPWPR